MNIGILSPDAQGQIDPTLMQTLYGPLANVPIVDHNTDVAVVPISYIPDFIFNQGLRTFDKPWVMVDFCEYFCQAGDQTHLFGISNESPIEHYGTEEWAKFRDWVADNPPILYFKRELFEKDRGENLLPIEYPVSLPIPPVQSREEFDARQWEVFNCWGLSNHARSKFHGEVFSMAGELGITVADSWKMMDHFTAHPEGQRMWATIFTHCSQRVHIDNLLSYQHRAKVACAFPGAGVKCFRHGESCVGNVMAMPVDEMAWSFPWLEGENCLRFTGIAHLADQIPDTANGENTLYDIYLAGQETAARYASARYCDEYVRPEIEKRI